MANNRKDSSFNVLGSSKLNTSDGKNPTSSESNFNVLGSSRLNTPDGADPAATDGRAVGQPNTGQYREQCRSAHDALEDRLRDEEREHKWTGKW
ncbi:hypothetical protein MMC28_011479 [Mycoblastus sanguinarius]|nr:hypothetical protein [Mycoblastus sanguinarius]